MPVSGLAALRRGHYYYLLVLSLCSSLSEPERRWRRCDCRYFVAPNFKPKLPVKLTLRLPVQCARAMRSAAVPAGPS